MQYALCTQSLSTVHYFDEENWMNCEQNKEKTPFGEAVTGLWSYPTHPQRDRLWCSKKIPLKQPANSPENNCQAVFLSTSTAPRVVPASTLRAYLFIFCSNSLLLYYKLALHTGAVVMCLPASPGYGAWSTHFEVLNVLLFSLVWRMKIYYFNWW